jgi:hypothetical protein
MVEVEFVGNRDHYFRPMGRVIRGRLETSAMPERGATDLAREFSSVPGMVLGLADDGNAYLREPLHEPAHAGIRKKLERRFTIADEREDLGKVDLPTFVWWIGQAIEAELARIVRGALPEVKGRVRKNFLHADREDPRRRLEKMQLAAALATMTPQQRKEYERILAEME